MLPVNEQSQDVHSEPDERQGQPGKEMAPLVSIGLASRGCWRPRCGSPRPRAPARSLCSLSGRSHGSPA
jgi:hypothetical protein